MTYSRFLLAFSSAILFPALLPSQTTTDPVVQFQTRLGNINVQLLPENAPKTVANFLNYVRKGAYTNSLIHRSVPGFVIQGGGYVLQGQVPTAIPADPPVQNEFGVSNTRGTLAMAKLGSDPNSATSQWFFNEGDNSANLDHTDGGFTVFGKVADAASLAVMDAIAAVPVPNPPVLPSPYDQAPILNYTQGAAVSTANLVLVNAIVELNTGPAPTMGVTGAVTASDFGGFAAAAPGSYIEIYGTNLAGTSRAWAASDFTNGNAPTELDGVTVTLNGVPAYVSYVSPGQVNVQVPANVPVNRGAPIVVSYGGNSTVPVSLPISELEPGLLAPASFVVGTTPYVEAFHSAGNTVVSNGTIPNTASAPLVGGETIVLYGVGFGPVKGTTVPIAGQIVQNTASLASPLQVSIGHVAAQVTYAGLVPGYVGLYQINVVVPSGLPSGDLTLGVVLGGVPIQQNLAISAQ